MSLPFGNRSDVFKLAKFASHFTVFVRLSMRKRGHLNSKGEAVPIPWPTGAWARIQIKRPLEHSAERYIFKNEVNIGRAATLADDDFRIDLKQVGRPAIVPSACHVVVRSAASTAVFAGDRVTIAQPLFTEGVRCDPALSP